MKALSCTWLLSVCFLMSFAQQYPELTKADECYKNKDYKCAEENYKTAVNNNRNPSSSYIEILFRIGYSLTSLQNYSEANPYYQKVLAENPSHKLATWNLAWNLYKLKDYNQSINYYTKTLDFYNDDKQSLSKINYWIGQNYFALKNYQKALESYTTAMEIDNTNKDAYWGVAAANYNAKQYNSAVDYYTKCIDLYLGDNKSLVDLYYYRGMSLEENGQSLEAIPDFKIALSLNSEYKYAYYDLAACYYRTYMYDSAIMFYTKAMELYKGDNGTLAELYEWRGKSYRYLSPSKPKEAEADLLLASSLSSGNADLLWDIGEFYFNALNDYGKAYEYYSKALDNFKGDVSDRARLYHNKGLSLKRLKNIKKAEEEFRKAINDSSGYTSAIYQLTSVLVEQKKWTEVVSYATKAIPLEKSFSADLADVYYWRGQANMALKKPELAIPDLESSVKANSYLQGPNKLLGDFYFEKQNYKDAYKYYNNIILELDVKDTSNLKKTYFNYAKSALDQKLNSTSKTYVEKYIKLDTTNWEAYKLFGIAYFNDAWSPDANKALENYNKAIYKYKGIDKKTKAELLSDRGMIYVKLGKNELAKSDLIEVKKLTPENYDSRWRLGEAYFNLKQYDKASIEFTELLQLVKPEYKDGIATLHFNKGRCLYELGKKEEAKQSFTKAVELKPTYNDAKQWLDYVNKGTN